MTTDVFKKRYYSMPRAEIGYLRFILESYDGLAFARTLDNRAALVEIAYSASRSADVEALLAQLEEDAGLQEVAVPDYVLPL